MPHSASIPPHIAGIIFDKDGTLLDFHRTWDSTFGQILHQLLDDHPTVLAEAATAIGYDLEHGRVQPGSPLIAESGGFIIDLLQPIVAPVFSGNLALTFDAMLADIGTSLVVEADGATAVLEQLQLIGMPMGVATNDAEATARAQLRHLEWDPYLSIVVGYDSGFGAKPDPGMVIGCAELLRVPVHQCLMIGDSSHDLLAGRDAGAVPILVGDDTSALPHAALQIANLHGLLDLLRANGTALP